LEKTTKRVLNIGLPEDGQKQVQAIHSKIRQEINAISCLSSRREGFRHFIRKPSSGFDLLLLDIFKPTQ
jgi:hypothetical protein